MLNKEMDIMMNWLKSMWARKPVNRAVRTALQSFVALFSVAIMPWLMDVMNWANGNDKVFPSVDTAGKAVVSATFAMLIGLISAAHNWIEDHISYKPTQTVTIPADATVTVADAPAAVTVVAPAAPAVADSAVVANP